VEKDGLKDRQKAGDEEKCEGPRRVQVPAIRKLREELTKSTLKGAHLRGEREKRVRSRIE